MNKFVEAHADNIHAEISCVDRIIFKGYSSLSWADNMESYLSYNNILIKDFKKYAQSLSHRLRDHGLSMAQKFDRPYFKPSGKYNKEERACEIAAKDNITSGLVAVMSAVEASPTFKMIPGEGRPKLINASIPQLCLYYYFMNQELGLMHIRIQTWLPFSVQIYLNGHDWLARQMDKHKIKYHQADNCFPWIEKPEEAQKLADQFNRMKWEKLLPKFAELVNPLSPDEFCANYYWVLDQVEYATDIWIKNNWMKMYNKFGSVLRVETVINDPYSFKILRYGKRKGELVYGWYPMAKGVANLYRYGEIGLAANHAYLDALAVVRDDRPAKESLQKLTEPVKRKGKSYGAFNPLRFEEVRLFQSVMNGNFIAFGFQNRDIRETIFGHSGSKRETARLSAKTGRYLKKLQMHGLIAKVPRSRRWKVTPYGWQTMQAAIEIYNVGWAHVINRQAA